MALIECPECGHQVSDRAHSCPSCGYPVEGPATSGDLSIEPLDAPLSTVPVQLDTRDVVEFDGSGRFAHEPGWRRVTVRLVPARSTLSITDGEHSMLGATRLDDLSITRDGLGTYEIRRRRGNLKPIQFIPHSDRTFEESIPVAGGFSPTSRGAIGAGERSLPTTGTLSTVVSGFTKTVAGFLFATAGVFGLSALLYVGVRGEYADYLSEPAGAEGSSAAGAADSLYGLAWFLVVVTGVMFLVWFNQAYKAAASHGAPRTSWSSGWAVGGWFIPIANFVIPKLVMNEIDRMSHPANGPPPIGEGWKNRPRLVASDLWWAAWVIATIAAIGESVTLDAGNADNVVLWAAAGSALLAAAGGLLGSVVLTIGGRLPASPRR